MNINTASAEEVRDALKGVGPVIWNGLLPYQGRKRAVPEQRRI